VRLYHEVGWTFAGDTARVAEDHDLTLTLSGSALGEAVLEEPITLEGLVRALAFLTNRPLPLNGVLPMTPDWERAVWSTVAQLEVDSRETVNSSSGSSLTVLSLPLINMDTRIHTLPNWIQESWYHDRRGNISAVGLDNAGRHFPVVAFLCGESTVMPSARRDCQLVWDLPPGIELTTVELELRARIYHDIE